MYPDPKPMVLAYSLRSYQTVATQTAAPGQLVVMLYDGAIRFLERALGGFQYDDPLSSTGPSIIISCAPRKSSSSSNHSLDLDRGGKLAGTLAGICTPTSITSLP